MKYQSITTPEVQHDVSNFLTEIFFLNKHGLYKPYAWRKGNALAKDWPKIVSIFRKLVKTHRILPEQLAWYLYKYQPKSIDIDSFGLMVWRIRKLFGKYSLKKIHSIYSAKFCNSANDLIIINDYKYSDSCNDNLFDVLDRLENKSAKKEKNR